MGAVSSPCATSQARVTCAGVASSSDGAAPRDELEGERT
jgi:hypothetical protein